MRARLPVLLALPLLLGPGLLGVPERRLLRRPAAVGRHRGVGAAGGRRGHAPAAAAGVRTGPRARSRGLAALTAWTAISLAWAPDGGAAVDDVQRLLLYLAATCALAIARARDASTEPLLLAGDRRRVPVRPVRALRARRSSTSQDVRVRRRPARLPAHLLERDRRVRRARARPRGRRSRATPAGPPGCARRPPRPRPPLALTVLLTFSRGALGALAAGVLLLLALAPSRGRLARRAARRRRRHGRRRASSPWRSTACGRPKARPARRASPRSPGCWRRWPRAALARSRARGGAGTLRRRRCGRLALAAIALVLVGTVVAACSASSARRGGDDPRGRARSGSPPCRATATRTGRSPSRAFADHPLLGEGSGSFRAEWLREREFREAVRDAHSLYLETRGRARPRRAALLLALLVGGCAVAAVRAGPALAGRGGRAGGVRAARGHRLGLGAAGAHARRAGAGGAAHRGGRASNSGGCRGGGWPSPMSAWFALRRGTASPAGRSAARSERTKNALTPADSVWTSA